MLSGNFIVDIQPLLLVSIEWTRTGLVSLKVRGSIVIASKISISSINVSRISVIVVIVITTIRDISSVKDISVSVITRVRVTVSIFVARQRLNAAHCIADTFLP